MLTALSVGRGGLGRFGNCCWTIAGTIGIAVKSGQPYGFPPWRVIDSLNFGSKEDIDVYMYLEDDLPPIYSVNNWQESGYWWGYEDKKYPQGNWNLHGHMQSDRYFSHCKDLIRHIFRFKDEPEQNDYVAIHYRAGDYQEGDDCHHPRQTKDYYEKAMDLFPNERFLIFSDDIEAAAKMFPGLECSITNSYIKDFTMMKKCKSFITANSSFSSFAAMLGDHPDKKVVMPERWFGKAWGSNYKDLSKDIYLEKSIVL